MGESSRPPSDPEARVRPEGAAPPGAFGKARRRSAGIVPVRWCPRGSGPPVPHVLVLRAYGNWDFPKGSLDPGEGPVEAALRELREEAGLREPCFRWGMVHFDTPPYGRGKVARYYLAEVPRGEVALGVNPELGRPEHHEYRWVSFDEGERLLGPRLRPVLAWARRIVEGTHAPPPDAGQDTCREPDSRA